MTTVDYATLAYPTLTREQINEAAEAATRAYFEAILEQGRSFDHHELSFMIDTFIVGAETKIFVESNR